VLAHEGVDDPARAAARERARDRGAAGRGERVAVDRRVAASGARISAVPICAAAAPAASTAATARPVAIPPVATSGSRDRGGDELQQREQPDVAGPSSTNAPRWPPAS
jgi:hypothetical protein